MPQICRFGGNLAPDSGAVVPLDLGGADVVEVAAPGLEGLGLGVGNLEVHGLAGEGWVGEGRRQQYGQSSIAKWAGPSEPNFCPLHAEHHDAFIAVFECLRCHDGHLLAIGVGPLCRHQLQVLPGRWCAAARAFGSAVAGAGSVVRQPWVIL